MFRPTPDDIAYMKAHANDDRRPWAIAANVLCFAAGCLAVTLRFLSRSMIGTKTGLDDWLIALALLFLTGHVVSLLVATHLGMGRHAILVHDIKGLAVASLVAQTCYNLCITTTKLSILSLYARIFNRAAGWFTPILYGTGLFVFLYTIPQCFTYIFRCVPVESLWTEYGPEVKVSCLNFHAIIISFGIINIITDWFILALPLPLILGLKLERKAKWSICSLFMIGGLVCVFSIVRLIYARIGTTVDPSWDATPIAIISSIECASGILAACMPTWRPLFRVLRKDTTWSSLSNHRSQTTSNRSIGYKRTTPAHKRRGDWRNQIRVVGPVIEHNGMNPDTQGVKTGRNGLSAPRDGKIFGSGEIELSKWDSKSSTNRLRP